MEAVYAINLWPLVILFWLVLLIGFFRLDRSAFSVRHRETDRGLRTLLLKLFLEWDSDRPITLEEIASHLNFVAPKAPIFMFRTLCSRIHVDIYWTEGNTAVLLDRLKIDLAQVNREIRNRSRAE